MTDKTFFEASATGARRRLLKVSGPAIAALGALSLMGGTASAQESNAPSPAPTTSAWDKTFPKSHRVDHRKVAFTNRLGIRIVADLYVPRNLDRSQRHSAIVVGGPYGAVKEQSSGLYAQTMAERGFIAIAHDPSYVGESGGRPYNTTSSEALLEDFSAAVDYLGTLSFVDRERIGVLGVCGSGGFGLAAAEIDQRIKAVATVSMYDIGQASRQGLSPTLDLTAFRNSLNRVAEARWAAVDGAEQEVRPGTPVRLTESSTAIDREFFDYYRTPRGQHPRASTGFLPTGAAQMALWSAFDKLDWLSPRPVLFITGDEAHSRSFSEQAYRLTSGPKELFIVPGAGHVDLYDRVNLIPFDKLTDFFRTNLSGGSR
ncbi:MAG TPA: alpha/beta hydrolase [Allosphingosinicella sp.]